MLARGWAAINESDMLIIPDPSTAIMDPFFEVPTIIMLGTIQDPITKQRYDRDPRNIARKAEAYLTNSGLADTCYVGAEAEFSNPRVRGKPPTDRQLVTAPKLPLGLPSGVGNSGNAETSADLSEHAWAGARVTTDNKPAP